MNKLLRNYIYNVLYQIFLIIVPLVTAPYLSRVLSSESIGVHGYINSVVSIVTTFGLLGLQSYGYRQIAYKRDNRKNMSQTFIELFILRCILLCVVSVIYIPITLRTEYKNFYLIQYFLILSQFIDVSWVFIGVEDLKVVTLRNFSAKLITVIGIFVFVKKDADLWKYFALFSIATLFTIFSVFPLLKKYISITKVKLMDVFMHIVPAIKLFVPQVATTLYLQIGKIMLENISGDSSQVAYYDYAEKIINIPLAIITALGTVLMPRLANLYVKNDEKSIETYLNKTMQFALFLAFPMMFGLSAIAPKWIPWYLGKEYISTAYTIIAMSPICVLNTILNILGTQYLTAINKTGVLNKSYYGAALVNLVFNAMLIPRLGCMGAAISLVIGTIYSVVIQYRYVRQHILFKEIQKGLTKNIMSSIVLFVILLNISRVLPIGPISTFVEVFVGVVIYLIMEFLLRDPMLIYLFVKGKELFWKIRKMKLR